MIIINQYYLRIFKNKLISLLFIFISSNAFSAATGYQAHKIDPYGSLDKFNNNLKKVGITYTQADKNIEITVDEQKTLSQLTRLEFQGVVSTMDSDVVNVAPLSVSVVIVGVSSTINIVNSVFERNHLLDNVHVQGYVIPIGSTVKQPCYSFDYDRKNFMMLDLSDLTPRKFVRRTPNFMFSDWCKKILDTESANI